MLIIIEILIFTLLAITFPGLSWPTATYFWGKPVDTSKLSKRQKNDIRSFQGEQFTWAQSNMPNALMALLFCCMCLRLFVVHYYDLNYSITMMPFFYVICAYNSSRSRIIERQYLYEIELSTLCPKCEYDMQQIKTGICPECGFELKTRLNPRAPRKTETS